MKSKHVKNTSSYFQILALKVESETGTLYTTWSGATTSRNDTSSDDVEINGLFATKQGLKHNQEVKSIICLLNFNLTVPYFCLHFLKGNMVVLHLSYL